MDLAQRLGEHAEQLREDAVAHHRLAHEGHYEKLGEDFVRERLGVLIDQVVAGVRDNSPVGMLRHVESVAEQRYHQGFQVEELQSFYNAVEEAIWGDLVAYEPRETLAAALATVGGIIGAGKDRMAQVYVELASRHHAPAIDVDQLFAGV
jgi:hypothetical protein